jgi:hypothetical protein
MGDGQPSSRCKVSFHAGCVLRRAGSLDAMINCWVIAHELAHELQHKQNPDFL